MAIIAENSINPRSRDVTNINELIGIKMFDACQNHFSSIPHGLGIGNDSCTAAVAVAADHHYPQRISTSFNGISVNFSLVYGTSLAHQGFDPGYNVMRAYKDRGLTRDTKNSVQRSANVVPNDGSHQRSISSRRFFEHAEQVAILSAESTGASFFKMGIAHHLYIDFRPCDNCRAWLISRPEPWYLHIAEGATDNDPRGFDRKGLAELKEGLRKLNKSGAR